MRTPTKLAAYGAALVLVFFGALGIGTVVGDPVSTPDEAHGGSQGAVLDLPHGSAVHTTGQDR